MPPRRPKEEDDAVTDDEDYQPNDNRGECDELQDDDEMLDSDVSAASQKLFPVLNKPVMRAVKAMMLYEMIRDGEINLQPAYQRDEVWKSDAQAAVLASYLQKYHVPPLVLSDKGDGKYDCIDGKQRLTSIKRFFDGELPITSPGISNKFWYIRNERNKNRPGSLLPPTQKSKAENLEIYLTIYTNLTDEQEREMFKRVQDGKSLNLAEKLHAISSEWTNLIRQVNNEIPDKYWERVHFRTSRMSSFLNLCRLVWYLTRLGYPSNSELDNLPHVPMHDDLREWLTRKLDMRSEELREFSPSSREITAPTPKFKAFVDAIFKKFMVIINSSECYDVAFCHVSKLPIASNEAWLARYYPKKEVHAIRMTISPVEVICSCIYISRNIRLRPATLARGIHNIRSLIYERFVNERKLNKQVMTQFFNWLKSHNGDGGVAADYQIPALPPGAGHGYVPGPSTSPAARTDGQPPKKRAVEADSSQATPQSKKQKTESVAGQNSPMPVATSSTHTFSPLGYPPR